MRAQNNSKSRAVAVLPLLGWIADYSRRDLSSDTLAAVIVTIMLVPQSLAYAMLANLPPQVGLYASIVPLIGYALFGSSRALAVGPVAVVSLMTASAIGVVAEPGTAEFMAAAVLLAALSGVFLFALGLFRLGALATLLSHPVVSGFMTGAAILIALSQLGHILGLPLSGSTLPAFWQSITEIEAGPNLVTSIIGIATVAFLFAVRRYLGGVLRRWGLSAFLADVVVKAAPVLAVIASVVAVGALELSSRFGVAVVGAIPGGLPPLTIPALDPGLIGALIVPAMLISVIGFVESVSVAQSLAARSREKIDANRELMGLGAANLGAAFTAGYPVTGGFARSVVNHAAGARTPIAGIFTAALMALTAIALTPAFHNLPNAVLGATIIVAVLGLVDFRSIVRTWRYSRADGAALIVTLALVMIEGIEAGILAGVALSLALLIWRTARPHVAVVGRVPGTEHYRNINRHEVLTDDAVVAVRVDESLNFANARALEDQLVGLVADRPAARHLVLICSAVNAIDASALESLEALNARLKDSGVDLHLAEVKGPVMDRLTGTEFLQHLSGAIHLSTHGAMTALATDPSSGRVSAYIASNTDGSAPASASPPSTAKI
ncbi:sulfate permease [Fodinicurvata sp. EGI_FJ10296]|uniref:SulP family inorganic anion transporter n=1 Tax=Fodinicurvata sp. EGI_FJ10296 TaxID=3231908 RepID=UPI0034556F6D